MFKKKKQKTDDFDEKIKAAKYERILKTLKDILNVNQTKQGVNGKEEPDYAATCSAIKTKARLAIDFVTDLDKDDNGEN